MSDLISQEFLDGQPLLKQTKVGELVPLRMVHPWGISNMYQVRILLHGAEVCISDALYERDHCLMQARCWLEGAAARLLNMREGLQ